MVVQMKNGKEITTKKGEIMLNPGDYRLPKPHNANNTYHYYGYFIAEDEDQLGGLFNDGNFGMKQSEFEHNNQMLTDIRDRVAEYQFNDGK